MNEDIKVLINELIDLLDKRNLKFVMCIDYVDDLTLIRQTHDDKNMESIAKFAHETLFGEDLNSLI